MKTKHYILFVVVSLMIPFLNSCYAFLKADKLVYAGTVAKRPVEIKVDSTFNTEVITDDFKEQ